MSDLDCALWKQIIHIVQNQNRPFCNLDFVPKFVLEGKEFKISTGTFRNKVSDLLKNGKLEVVYYSPQAFYTLKGVNFAKPMTGHHAGVIYPYHQGDRRLLNDPVYRIIQNLPLGKRSLHNIHIRFEVNGIWSIMSSSYNTEPMSNDIQLHPWPWKIRDLDVKVTVHPTDTVTVVIGCSFCPVVVDLNGVIRLSNALSTVQERLHNILSRCGSSDGSTISVLPDPMTWTVTMWHFGADGLITYEGEKFFTSWEVGQHALITTYAKDWKDGKTRIRIEKQEYPKKSLAYALEEKLNTSRGP
jgi:hypothetical protein